MLFHSASAADFPFGPEKSSFTGSETAVSLFQQRNGFRRVF